MLKFRRISTLAVVGILGLSTVGCGHSEEEWQAKLKEIQGLNGRLTKCDNDKKKCEDDLAKATDENANLKSELLKANGQMGDLSKTAEERRRMIEKLKREKEQLDAIRARFEKLKRKLQELTKLGLNVTVRGNRMVIQLPGDILFDSGRVDLRAQGKQMQVWLLGTIKLRVTLITNPIPVLFETTGA
jgi:chemotaxis protein MotB